MADPAKSDSLATWFPSPDQQEAAEYLAAGYSQFRTAEITGHGQAVIWRWTRVPEFAAYVADLREKLVAAQRPLYEHSVSIAQQIVLRALTGEPVDKLDYDRAERLLQSTLWRTAKPRAAKGDDGDEQRQLPEGQR